MGKETVWILSIYDWTQSAVLMTVKGLVGARQMTPSTVTTLSEMGVSGVRATAEESLERRPSKLRSVR